ncbi:MAG TPA: DUF5320 domain-containing protein [Victivallales bacterium]|nr:DUF5320 domain-containing protein [Victivallales bacterium]HPO89607.1 DUF5320 domain-containing protein [Victivallales bacterium]HRR05935.1 DUF5320 domain-containing protein [Victivallales bacterium]HRR27762.1 DUF5320 domain-containing protein [Victivallales bacterium]HRU01949.1 DUF5320 domain-containing protein [Victivallales bacterium]
MPRGDGTGPMELGPMTGRGAGYCAGFNVPGFMNNGQYWIGRGFFCRGGRGRGYRNMYYATGLPGWARGNINTPAPNQNPDIEKQYLKNYAESLEKELSQIKARIDEIDGAKK